jgi:N-acetylmuramic acid 6-phosphate etherase
MIANVPETERQNPRTVNIDRLPVEEILGKINDEDALIAPAVRKAIPDITRAVQTAEETLRRGGRCVYVGCGTSGRLGVLDASECPPTFGIEPDVFVGMIAGGETALRHAAEGAEDNRKQAETDLREISLNENDFVIGLAASGRTPYVLGALEYARHAGCKTAMISNAVITPGTLIDIIIFLDTGAEALTGSTRMKAGTALKMTLNMISTATMIRMGKVYGNLMVDVRPTNTKLTDRACRMVVEITGCPYETAQKKLSEAEGQVKTAVLMILKNTDVKTARAILEKNAGRLHEALI